MFQDLYMLLDFAEEACHFYGMLLESENFQMYEPIEQVAAKTCQSMVKAALHYQIFWKVVNGEMHHAD